MVFGLNLRCWLRGSWNLRLIDRLAETQQKDWKKEAHDELLSAGKYSPEGGAS